MAIYGTGTPLTPSESDATEDVRPRALCPIAICGIGLRLPGDIRNTEDFWHLLVNGKDARRPLGEDRYNTDGFDDALGAKVSIKPKWGYFLNEDLTKFDPSFFSMTQKEADRCDPQQRLLLEITRECLEDAGEVDYRGQSIGCYVGTFVSGFSRCVLTPVFGLVGHFIAEGRESKASETDFITYSHVLAGL